MKKVKAFWCPDCKKAKVLSRKSPKD